MIGLTELQVCCVKNCEQLLEYKTPDTLSWRLPHTALHPHTHPHTHAYKHACMHAQSLAVLTAVLSSAGTCSSFPSFFLSLVSVDVTNAAFQFPFTLLAFYKIKNILIRMQMSFLHQYLTCASIILFFSLSAAIDRSTLTSSLSRFLRYVFHFFLHFPLSSSVMSRLRELSIP